MYEAIVTIDLHSIEADNYTEAEAIVSKFLDWLDEATAVEGWSYDYSDFKLSEYRNVEIEEAK
ncbi:MAG: hypothetical protein CL735_04780 [Chloroflexi bacterium]|nr:hypothetical protein [Chloroflexota bacterium]|tara:strand:+ start:270 stop:458 length:189 start_codon:yes stop_codon:yes gene_type:complete